MSSLSPILSVTKSKEKPMKIFQIFLDGIDKTGKDLIRSYIFYLAKGRYICVARGYASMVVYSNLYDRPYEYDMTTQSICLNVLLEVDKDDWEIRCKNSNEPLTNYEAEVIAFRNVFTELEQSGYHTLRFNTSRVTPFSIAKAIIRYMEKINGSH